MEYKIISVNKENIDNEHICCAITDKKGETCVSSKKDWMRSQFDSGLTFKRFDIRGKVFIEYIPAENAWVPVEAPGYLHINCLWVSGQYKNQGYANSLLEECINDAKALGKSGLVILSSQKKMAFLSDPEFLKHKGFSVCDKAAPYFTLMYLPLKENAVIPRFKECCREGKTDEKGFVLYCTNQCPFISKYVPVIENAAKDMGTDLKVIKFENASDAQMSPSPFTTYSLFHNGDFITNEILSESKFKKILEEKSSKR